MEEITVVEMNELKMKKVEFQLIDVREQKEFDFANLGGELVPMSQVPQHIDQIKRDQLVIMMCRSGKRSADVIRFLEEKHGFDNLKNLKGGILAWSDEIDPTIPKY